MLGRTTAALGEVYTMIYNNAEIEIRRTKEFDKWLKRLKDRNAKTRINLRIRKIEVTADLGDYKQLGDGVCELRIDYGPGYRLYFAIRERHVLLLLIGGDKTSQQRDIKKARNLNRKYKQ